MVDTFNAQDVNTIRYGIGTAVFTLMCGTPKPAGRRQPKRRFERSGIHAGLGGIHADTNDPFEPSCARSAKIGNLLDKFKPGTRAVGAVNVGNQGTTSANLRFTALNAFTQTRYDLGQFLSLGEVPRGREERLGVYPAVGCRVNDTLICEASPVLAGHQALLHYPEDPQKFIQITILIELVQVVCGHRHAVLPAKL
jgi:hypothetical protein